MNKPYPAPVVNIPSTLAEDDVVTSRRLLNDLATLGVKNGDTLCVHSAYSRIGYVIGGPRTVLESLLAAVGPSGTVAMPAFSGDLSDPAEWKYPGLPAEMVEEARASLPGYHPRLTPTRGLGLLPELFRNRPDTLRSPHPQSSFSACGAKAEAICQNHPLDYRFGHDSPLGALVRLGAKVLMLGAPWNTASLFYLTEFSMPDRTECVRRAPVEENGVTVWKTYRDLNYRNTWHDAVVHLLGKGIAVRGLIGKADSILFSAPEAVEEIVRWRLAGGAAAKVPETSTPAAR